MDKQGGGRGLNICLYINRVLGVDNMGVDIKTNCLSATVAEI